MTPRRIDQNDSRDRLSNALFMIIYIVIIAAFIIIVTKYKLFETLGIAESGDIIVLISVISAPIIFASMNYAAVENKIKYLDDEIKDVRDEIKDVRMESRNDFEKLNNKIDNVYLKVMDLILLNTKNLSKVEAQIEEILNTVRHKQ